MRRREFITLLGGAAFAWPLTARAQQAGRIARVGVLGPNLTNSVTGPGYQVFLSELRKLGFTEGQNLVVEYRRIGGARDYVYHSTGKPVRDLPITMENLL